MPWPTAWNATRSGMNRARAIPVTLPCGPTIAATTYIEVEDDGRGIDYEKVRKTAVEHGLLSAESAAELGERDLLDLLFQPGFSTAPRKTELAGRGVGLDVVKSNLALLNG